MHEDDETLETSRFATVYSLRTDDAGRYSVVAFDRFGKRVSDHPLQGLSFGSPREAFDAIRRTEKGSGEVVKVDVTAVAAARSA
jgi:hypothetical protein